MLNEIRLGVLNTKLMMLNMFELMKFLMLRMDWTFNCKSGAFAHVDMRE